MAESVPIRKGTSEHRDAFGWPRTVSVDQDHYIRSYDSRLKPLVVQTTKQDLLSQSSSAWQRVSVRTKTSLLSRLLYWTWSRSNDQDDEDGCLLMLKWLPACLLMLVLFCFPQNIGGETKNNGFYDPIRDRDRYYSNASRNRREDKPTQVKDRAEQRWPADSHDQLEKLLNSTLTMRNIDDDPENEVGRNDDSYLGLARRPLRPRLLCVLKELASNSTNQIEPTGRKTTC